MRDDDRPLTWAKGESPLPGCVLTEDGPFARGGSGEVWRAVTAAGFRLVLKRVRLGEKLAAEEERAMKLLPSLARHPHLLDVRDVQWHGGELVIAMEEADGSLKHRLAACHGEGLPIEELLTFMRDAAEGIDHLNAQGVQHRDIKPDNLLIVGGRVKVGDFGLAKVLERTHGTHSGPMTPAYAAPEWRMRQSSRQSDQYSLAVTYYHLRNARLPPDLSRLPAAEARVVGRALSDNPDGRWPDCKTFVEALECAHKGIAAPGRTTVPPRPTPTRESLLELFKKLHPRSQLGRLMGLVGMPSEYRPADTLPYARRVDEVLDWAENTPLGFEAIDNRIRELLGEQRAALKKSTAKDDALQTPPDPFPGEYRFLKILGRGTYGSVWLAEQLNLESRPVAVKTISVSVDSLSGPSVVAALQNDAHALAKVKHRNVVRVHDLRISDQHPYLIMEFVEGGSLLDRLRQRGKPLGWQEAAKRVADVGEALLEAHSHGLIHRDIKPANILFDIKAKEALLTDFGVSARLADTHHGPAGTPPYMAPEAWAWDGKVSPALDVFSLAVTWYQLLTGKVPFPAADLLGRLDQIRQGLPDPDPRCEGLPEPLEKTLRAGLAFEADQRPHLDWFVAELRGELNKGIADTLLVPTTGGLRLVVSRQVSPGFFQPITTSPPRRLDPTRTMRPAHPVPEQVHLRTGDRVRVEAVADRDGYLTVFNIAPTGELVLLYPDAHSTLPPPALKAGQPLPVVEVEMTPPAGRERLVAVWSARPLLLNEIMTAGAGSDGPEVSGPYRATREMERVQAALQALPPEEARAVVLELDHVAPAPGLT